MADQLELGAEVEVESGPTLLERLALELDLTLRQLEDIEMPDSTRIRDLSAAVLSLTEAIAIIRRGGDEFEPPSED